MNSTLPPSSKIEKIAQVVILATLIFLPLLPNFPGADTGLQPRTFFLVLTTTLLVFLATAGSLTGKMTVFPTGRSLFLLLLLESSLLTSFFFSSARPRSAASDFWALVCLPLWAALTVGFIQRSPGLGARLHRAFVALGLLVTPLFLIGYLGLFGTPTGNPLGSPKQAAIIFATLALFALHQLQGKTGRMVLPLLGLILAGVGLTLANPMAARAFGSPFPLFLRLDWGSSLAVFFGAFKAFPLWGLGPGLYQTAFNLYKPVGFNTSPLFPHHFDEGANLYLTLATEVGAVATLALIFYLGNSVLRILKRLFASTSQIGVSAARLSSPTPGVGCDNNGLPGSIRLMETTGGAVTATGPASDWSQNWPATAAFFLFLLASFFENLSVLSLFYLFFLAALAQTASTTTPSVSGDSPPTKRLRWLALAIAFPASLFLIALTLWTSQALAAQITYRRSLAPGLPVGTVIERQTQAIELNPHFALYRRTLSQTLLSLANVLAADKELPAEVRDSIGRLIQNAAQAARQAVNLESLEAENYRNAGLVWSNLTGAVEGASKFAKDYFDRASLLSPTDPTLRLEAALALQKNGQAEDSLTYIEEALRLKPDYFSGRLLLARTLRQLKKNREAVAQYRVALNLLAQGGDQGGDVDPSFYQKIEKEMREVELR